MLIENASADDVPSKLRPLIEPFKAAAFSVAPEREDELVQLREKHGIGIYLKADAEDWLFQEFRMGKRIFVGLRTLERLWAYCYGYNTILTELQTAGPEGFSAIRNPEEYQLAFHVLKWASQKTLADKEGPWPPFLPEPSMTAELKHVETANHLFVAMSGRLILHELAHAILNHNTAPETPAEVLKAEELEADAWADDWIFSKWESYKSDDKVFIRRGLGIAFAHAPTLILGLNAKTSSDSHPSPIERILHFVDRHLPGGNPHDKRRIDFPAVFLVGIASHLVFTTGTEPPVHPIPTSYHEWLLRFAPFFP